MDRESIPYVEDFPPKVLAATVSLLKRLVRQAEEERARRIAYTRHADMEAMAVSRGLLEACCREAGIDLPEVGPSDDPVNELYAAISVLISLSEEVSQGTLTQRSIQTAINHLDSRVRQAHADRDYQREYGRPARRVSPLAVCNPDRAI